MKLIHIYSIIAYCFYYHFYWQYTPLDPYAHQKLLPLILTSGKLCVNGSSGKLGGQDSFESIESFESCDRLTQSWSSQSSFSSLQRVPSYDSFDSEDYPTALHGHKPKGTFKDYVRERSDLSKDKPVIPAAALAGYTGESCCSLVFITQLVRPVTTCLPACPRCSAVLRCLYNTTPNQSEAKSHRQHNESQRIHHPFFFLLLFAGFCSAAASHLLPHYLPPASQPCFGFFFFYVFFFFQVVLATTEICREITLVPAHRE